MAEFSQSVLAEAFLLTSRFPMLDDNLDLLGGSCPISLSQKLAFKYARNCSAISADK
jgi:hypothetical protein